MSELDSILTLAKNHVPFHRRRAPQNYLELSEWPLTARDELALHGLHQNNDLLDERRSPGGYIAASGGTMAQPKYVYFSHEEFDVTSSHIARHFFANGLIAGDKVVNYFASGDMWAAYLLVDRSLSKLPVTVLPVGYTPRMDYAAALLERLSPDAIIGMPSMLLEFARYCRDRGKKIRLPKVYYGGEFLFPEGEQLLKEVWQCESIRSAGYASTDVGAIGWQCRHCAKDEYLPFEDIVLEIVHGEIVVTSLTRQAMPVIRYRTGDRGQWSATACDCAPGAASFRLKGRMDDVVIVWGCWISYGDIAEALESLDIPYSALQVSVEAIRDKHMMRVAVETAAELSGRTLSSVNSRIYDCCEDLHGIVSREYVQRHLKVERVPAGGMVRNARTGKILPIIDFRDSATAAGAA